MYGYKPQGRNRSIQANTRNPPQDPSRKNSRSKIKFGKPIVQEKLSTIWQKIIRLLKKVARK